MRPKEKASIFGRLKKPEITAFYSWFNKKVLHRDASENVVYLSVLIYTLIFSYFTIQKYNAFNAYAWDLGIFNQSLWTTLHSGKLFFSTVEQYIIPSGVFFGTHFSPILFVVLPFYAITSTPQALLVIQSLVLGLGAVPLYFFAKNSLNNKALAVIFSLAYLLYPPLQGANWFDFHVQAFLPLFFFCTMYFLSLEKWSGYFVFVFLSLTVAENVPITVVLIGLYGFWRFRKRIFMALKTRKLFDVFFLVPILTIIIAVIWFLFAGWIRQVNWPFDPQFLQLYKAVDNWSVLGIHDDPNKLPVYLLMQPGRLNVVQFLARSVGLSRVNVVVAALAFEWPLKLLYLFLLFGPLLFLSLGSPITAISLAWLVPALLSNYTPYYTIGAHFPTYPMAFVFLGAVEGLRKLSFSKSFSFTAKLVPRAKVVLVVSLIFTLTISPLSPLIGIAGGNISQFADYHLPVMTSHVELLQKISDMVPSEASILTQNSIFVHFSSRPDAYVYPLPLAQGYNDTILQTYVEGLFQKSQYVMLDARNDSYTSNQAITRILKVGDFGLIAFGDETREVVSTYKLHPPIDSGRSFPSERTPNTGDLFYRFDRENLYRYNGAEWVTVWICLFEKNSFG